MKKVLVISYYWPPSGGAGVQRWLKFVKYFESVGLEPIVLTVHPKYASYAITDASLEADVPEAIRVFRTKSREPFGLYKKFTGKKDIPYGGFANESNPGLLQKISRMIRGNLFIPDARVGWNTFAYKQALSLIKQYNIKTVITSSPPHSTQLIGLKLKKALGIRWIADLRDPWTEIYYYDRLYHSALAKKLDARYERNTLEASDAVVVVSEAIKRSFAQKSSEGVLEKIHVIPNGFDAVDFTGKAKWSTKDFIITYTGTIADNYNMHAFFKAVVRLMASIDHCKLKLRFVGEVSDGIKGQVITRGLESCVEYIKHVVHKESVDYLLSSTALLLVIPDVPKNEGILTGKLFEYLASQKQIIGLGPETGDAAVILKETEAGMMIDHNDEDQIYNQLHMLYKNWLDNPQIPVASKKFYEYSREALTKKFAKLV